jgi:pentatricopeptide repeat protein
MLEKIMGLIHEAGLQMNINSYEIIIQGLCANSELEHALDVLGDMTVSVNKDGQPDENGRPAIDIRPSLQCFLSIIQLAQSLHETETAFLVLKMAEVQAGLSRIPAVVYTDLMARAAEDYLVRQHWDNYS